MEYRQVQLKFRRILTSEEQSKLIAHFKGLVKVTKDGLGDQKKSIGKVMGVPFMDKIIGGGAMMETRIQGLLSEFEKDGRKTTVLEEMFNLEFDDQNPTVYEFTYPFLPALIGIDNMFKMVEKTGLKLDYHRFIKEEEKMMRGFCKNAGVLDELEAYEAKKITKD